MDIPVAEVDCFIDMYYLGEYFYPHSILYGDDMK